MADPDRAAAHALIEALAREPGRFDFYQALRLIECAYGDRPRLGTSLKAADDPVRLGQDPDLDFAPSTVASFAPDAEGLPPRLAVRFLGLFGPNGPLPLHLTDYARERILHHKDYTFARFADVFHHRMLSLFYRAWADAEPAVNHDRPDTDPYAGYLGALFGIGGPAFEERDAMPDAAKRYFAGLLACQARHADGLRAILGEFFGCGAEIREFVGEWMDIPERDQSRLGVSPAIASLGQSTVVGARVFGCQHKFRVVLGPLSLARYRSLLPGGAGLVALLAVVRNYAGDELVFDVNLILRRDEVPPLRLDGGAQLGWTTWLGERAAGRDADDLRLDPWFHGLSAAPERPGR
jgi:type VI secretion system protein ImpH